MIYCLFFPVDELDSYMYQTVGHQAINLYAEALGLPLYRRVIEGSSLNIGRGYRQREGDEVEDMYHLLKQVKVKLEMDSYAYAKDKLMINVLIQCLGT